MRAQPACAPAASIEGDETLVADATRMLAAAGVGTQPADGCAPVTVRLTRDGERIHLSLVDDDGRSGERTVRDLATAVAIVESWTLHEIAMPSPSSEEAPPPASTPALAASGGVVRAPRGAPRWGVGVGFASAYGADGSAWLGAAVSGCVRVGPLCLGALVRGAADGTTSADTTFEPMPGAGHNGNETLSGASGVDALVTVDAIWAPWGFIVRPGIGAGPGWVTVETVSHHMGEVTTQEHSGRVLRLDAHVSLGRPVAHGLSVELDLRTDTALLRASELEGPSSFARVTLGVRYEVP